MMRSVEDNSKKKAEYQVVKVEKTDPPSGTDGENWHTYVIERNNGTNIVGNRRGTLEQVKEYLREYVEDINLRTGNGGYSMWTTRKNKQTKQANK